MFKFMDWLNYKINEYLRFIGFEEKFVLNILWEFECIYEWIFVYFNKYRKNEVFLEVLIFCKECNDYIFLYLKIIFIKLG